MVTRRIALLSFPFGLPWLQLLSGDFPGQDLQGLLNVRKSKKQKEKRKKKVRRKGQSRPAFVSRLLSTYFPPPAEWPYEITAKGGLGTAPIVSFSSDSSKGGHDQP